MPSDLEPDELLVVREYKRLRAEKHGDLLISVKDGKLIKLWPTLKVDLSDLIRPPMREVPR